MSKSSLPQRMKNYAKLLGLGLIPLIVTIVVTLNYMDYRVIFLATGGALFLLSYVQSKREVGIVWKTLLISLPLLAFHTILFIHQSLEVRALIPIYLIITLIPIYVLIAYLGSISSTMFLGRIILVLLIGSTTTALIIPSVVREQLNEYYNEPAQSFELVNPITSELITNQTLEGKVNVISFFGTWCKPCVEEINELKHIHEHLKTESNEIAFMIVCTDKGGDTPDKAIDFYEQIDLPFTLAYDTYSETYKKYINSGVHPSLIIIDKKGNLRLKHEGYARSENLKNTLIPLITRMSQE